jgi:dihydroxyacetone kinase-like predicted kinase
VGDVIALIDDEITQAGDEYLGVIAAVLRNLEQAPEIITVYRGQAVEEAEARALIAALHADHPGVEFELQNGGQEHYPYVLSLE